MVLEQVSFSFRQMAFGVLKTLVVRAASNNIDLTYDVDPDIPGHLIGDFLRLQQVITNLVSNAIKFTPGVPNKGHVSLTCRRLALDHSAVRLKFCVSDSGIGIAKDKLNLISDAFTQADCSMIRVHATLYICSSANKPGFSLKEFGGVGLGLSISKYLVSLMGGSMWVESVAGEGSKFFFTITSQIGQPSMDTTLVRMMPFVNRNILFVDTQYDRTGVVDRVQELGLKPCVIHDLLDVADKAACPHIDIIFVDSLSVVCCSDIFSTFSFMDLALQTEMIRQYEHLWEIPVVLLAPVCSVFHTLWVSCANSGARQDLPRLNCT